jgi:hypothetical protein
MIQYRILMAMNLLVVAGVGVVFGWHVFQGEIYGYNLPVWVFWMGVAAAFPVVGRMLRRRGGGRAATVVLLVPLLPLLAGVALVVDFFLHPPRWN